MIKRFLIKHEYGIAERWKNIFYADQNHLHHLLLKIGLSKKNVLIILYLITLLFSIIAFFSWFTRETHNMIYNIIAIFLIIFVIRALLEWKINRKKKFYT